MSLLMEALRKAEQEKKEAAKRLREQEGKADQPEGGQSGELQLALEERLDVPGSPDGVIPQRDVPEPGSYVAKEGTGEMSPADDMPLSLSPFNDDATGAGGVADNTDTDRLAAADDAGDITIAGDEEEFEDTQADTIASGHWNLAVPGESTTRTDEHERAASSPDTDDGSLYEDTLQDTVRGSRTSESTRPGTVEQKLAAGATGTGKQFSPVTAQTVFAARRKPPSYTVHTVVALLLLGAVAAVSYGVFTYYTITPTVRELPSPTVAQGVEHVEPPPMLPVAESAGEIAAAGTIALAETVVESLAEPQLPPVVDIADAAPAATVAETDTADAVAAVDETAETIAAPSAAEALPAVEEGAAVMHPADADDMLELRPALLQISRSQPVEQTATAVNDAWHAYQQGHYDIAGSLYRAVLADDPEQRDALLGLAAIAIRDRQYDRAFDYYTHVLRLNPADRVAQSALISLQTRADPVASESRIRLLLEDAPKAAYLHFTLGNLYAAQSRWPEAQQAFFDAFRLDDGNPDYAHNLAVSLDRLGQPRASREYYRRALDLAAGRDVNFDTAQVATRLEVLSAGRDSR